VRLLRAATTAHSPTVTAPAYRVKSPRRLGCSRFSGYRDGPDRSGWPVTGANRRDVDRLTRVNRITRLNP
jgi:hypothetical protein